MATCINLREQFGSRYKITFDEAYSPKHVPRDKLDASMMQIPCRFGTVYAWVDSSLAVEVDYHPGIAKRLLASGCCELVQDGDHEKTFRFDVADYNTVAAIVRPRRRRQISDEQREKLRARALRHGFQKPTPDAPHGANTRFEARV